MKHLLAVTALATGILASLPGLAQDKTVVSFLHKFPEPENMAYFDAAVAEFEAANPTIDIVMEAVADEPYKDKIRVLMASDQVPDIYFSWSGEFGRKFARDGSGPACDGVENIARGREAGFHTSHRRVHRARHDATQAGNEAGFRADGNGARGSAHNIDDVAYAAVGANRVPVRIIGADGNRNAHL